MSSPAPSRPVLRYFGGKWRIAPWIIEHFPPHRVYVEPYGGGASVLIRKARSFAEVYNDLESEAVNVFRVLRDPGTAVALERLIRLTPYSRDDFSAAFDSSPDPVEQARRTIFKSYAGFASDSIFRKATVSLRTWTSIGNAPTGFRSSAHRSYTTPAHDWSSYPIQISRFCERLQGVVIENRSAESIIRQHDGEGTLIYADPPYVRSTRRRQDHVYSYEMNDDDHRSLSALLRSVRGMVVVSGYQSDLYDELYHDWTRVETDARCGSNGKDSQTIEVLWLSPKTVSGLSLGRCQQELSLEEGVAE